MVRLCLFDCDGTLVDSQHAIIAAMGSAFAVQGLPPAADDKVRSVVGLPLKSAIALLLPEGATANIDQLAEAYSGAYGALRRQGPLAEPLFAGVIETLDAIAERGWLLGIATGKSYRGALATLESHGLAGRFCTIQTADSGATKPDPDMILNALRETGADASRSVMIGDTAYDMIMARRAHARPLGVAWGYHGEEQLWSAGAERVVHAFPEIAAVLDDWFADETTPERYGR